MVKNVAIGVLLTVIGLVLFRGCPGSQDPPSSIDSLRADNRRLATAFERFLLQDSLIRVAERVKQDSFKREIAQRDVKIQRMKADTVVKYVRMAYPVVDTLIREQDTTIFTLKDQVKDLEVSRVKDSVRHVIMIVNKDTQLNNLQGLNTSLEAFNKSQTKTIKWQKIELWAWRVAAAGASTWGATRRRR